jgi:hypothetical protein
VDVRCFVVVGSAANFVVGGRGHVLNLVVDRCLKKRNGAGDKLSQNSRSAVTDSTLKFGGLPASREAEDAKMFRHNGRTYILGLAAKGDGEIGRLGSSFCGGLGSKNDKKMNRYF